MPILILEEGGGRRAFKVSQGKLVVGSGEAAQLKLASEDVAEQHAELEVQGDRVVLRPRPGVIAPKVDGVPAKGETVLRPGQRVSLGGATITVQAEEGQASAAPPNPPAPKVTAPKKVKQTGPRSVVERSTKRGRKQSSTPSWMTGAMIGGAILVGGIGIWFVAQKTQDQSAGVRAGDEGRMITSVQTAIDGGQYELARTRIDKLRTGADLSAAEIVQVDRLEDALEQAVAERGSLVDEGVGTRYWQNKLEKYERNDLAGEPGTPQIRVFLKRIAYFRERWPNHSKMDWVERQESRFEGVVDMKAEPTFAEMAWEVECLVRAKPRYYDEAIPMAEEFLDEASGKEKMAARELVVRLRQERQEYHDDRMQQAKYDYEVKDSAKDAVKWLVESAVGMGDADMESEAASYLLKMPNVEGHLLGYHKHRPEKYAQILENPVLKKFIVANELPTSID